MARAIDVHPEHAPLEVAAGEGQQERKRRGGSRGRGSENARTVRAINRTAKARMLARDGYDVTLDEVVGGVPKYKVVKDGGRHPNMVQRLTGDLDELFEDRRGELAPEIRAIEFRGRTSRYKG